MQPIMTPQRFQLEVLESRENPTGFGVPWSNPSISVSIAPDQTMIAGASNRLEASFNQTQSAAEWQREMQLAFQEWSRHANINVNWVTDNGAAFGTLGRVQDDPRFGDIRIGAVPLADTVLAVATPPGATVTNSRRGDIVFNSDIRFDNAPYHLRTVLLHEVGHALGLDHQADPNSVLFPDYNGMKTQLATVDIQAIQQLYGTRTPDIHEGALGNGNTSTATLLNPVAVNRTPLFTRGDLTTVNDVDVYTFTPPNDDDDDDDQKITVRLQSAGLSLLSARVQIYFIENGQEVEVANATANPNDAGSRIEVSFDADDESGKQYYIRVLAADGTAFNVGQYALAVNFVEPNTVIPSNLDAVLLNQTASLSGLELANLLEFGSSQLLNVDTGANDRLRSATLLPRQSTGINETIGSFHRWGDVDHYRIVSPATRTTSLAVTTWPLVGSAVQPMIELYSASGVRIATDTLVNDQGMQTIEARQISPNTSYVVRVLNGNAATGNYFLTTQFSKTSTTLETFASGRFTNATRTRTDVQLLTVSQQLFFNFTASGRGLPLGAGVRMEILDANGEVVFERFAAVGQTVSGTTNWLFAGEYQVRYEAINAGSRANQLSFTLRGINITDPVGPLLNDPTLTPPPGPTVPEMLLRYSLSIVNISPFYWLPNRRLTR